jgi:cation diffusion facilitator family transporter
MLPSPPSRVSHKGGAVRDEHVLTERNYLIRRASVIAITGNGLLALLKIIAGIVAGSMAVVSDGIDTSADVLVSFVTLIAVQIMSRPPDETHPYGHSRAETVATKVLAFSIFFVGAQLALVSVTRIYRGESMEVPSLLALYVTGISIVGKIFLALSQFRAGRKTSSGMVAAFARNMLNDIFISLTVIVGLLFTVLLDVPAIDLILAMGVSIWIMKTAVQIFMESNLEVMEGIRDHSLYDGIFEAVAAVPQAHNPHRARIRQIGNLYVIDLDIEVEGSLSVADAHRVAVQVEEKIRAVVANVYDIMVHVEPLGNVEVDEKYGLADNKR